MIGSGGEKPVVKCMLCQISDVVAAYRASLLGLGGVCSQVKRTTAAQFIGFAQGLCRWLYIGLLVVQLPTGIVFCLLKHKNRFCVTHFASFIHNEKVESLLFECRYL